MQTELDARAVFGLDDGQPLVVTVVTPFPIDEALAVLLREVVPDVQVHFTPYDEGRDVRASKGANKGRDPLGLPLPEVSDEMKDIWRRTHVTVALDMPANTDELFPSLKWVQAASAGLDQFDYEQLGAMGVRLSGAAGIASRSIAEFVMARLLGVWKNLRTIETQQRERVWNVTFGSEVGGRTLVIAGLGSIGRDLARRARAFDLTVLATRASAKPGDTDPDVDELHPASALIDLLPRADAVVCALPGNPSTADLFDAEMFAAMRQDAIFFNVGRGVQVVEPDLLAALHDGHLRAAILDVTRVEPIPQDDPLWDAPRIFLSPHSAVSLDRYQQNNWELTQHNLRLLLNGDRMRNEVLL